MKRVFVIAVCIVMTACAMPRPTTAQGVADGLEANGISYDSIQQAKKPEGRHFRFDEGIVLVADDLWVEIIRIEDERTFGIAEDASGLFKITEAVVGRELPGKPELYTRQPFLIIVRQEPEQGQVLEALNEVLPPVE